LLALICAGPISLISSHVKKGKKMTSHPSVKEKFDGGKIYNFYSISKNIYLFIYLAYDNQGKRVVVDGNLITRFFFLFYFFFFFFSFCFFKKIT